MTSATRNRFGEFGSVSAVHNSDQSRALGGSTIGQGFTNQTAWKSGIWGTAIGSGLKTTATDTSRPQDAELVSPGSSETKTGSGSLLSSSESDSWSRPQNGHWPSVSNISPGLASVRNTHSSTSPVRQRNQGSYIRSSSPHFGTGQQPAIGQGIAIKPTSSNHSFLDPTSGSFNSANAFDTYLQNNSLRQATEETYRRPLDSTAFGANDLGSSTYTGPGRTASNASVAYSGYNSNAASRSGSLPPSRHGNDPSLSYRGEQSTNMQNMQVGASDSFPFRPNHHSRTSTYSTTGTNKYADHGSSVQYSDLGTGFAKMDLGTEYQDTLSSYHDYTHLTAPTGANAAHLSGTNGLRSGGVPFELEGRSNSSLLPHFNHHRSQMADRLSYSPNGSDVRRSHESPMYSNGGTPPLGDHQRVASTTGMRGNVGIGEAAILERKLRGLQQQQQGYLSSQQNPQQYRTPFTHSYDYNPQSILRMNPLSPYYPLQPAQVYQTNVQNYAANRAVSQPTVDSNAGESIRSTVLEEFRTNNKGTKRYELKDIYNHVVEFSGDQHGSRFIQQKLENANSDEKEQIFREILPNSLQLMTDVFGNYVIQKFFEHGNQSQKKVLANQMKGHILELSLQMYGCRVVQKAFEHILTDQQASLVKELEHQVLKCVKDQNGNHVVQKAIERVPAEHIQFIINAFTGQVHGLATHPYGCRVVQRMLEHCRNPSRKQLLEELHACAPNLIVDQYGNYVTQHVIEHGDLEDRAKIIILITAQLITFSKHKFASNVVEKSIQHGSNAQRQKIVATLTALDDRGESPLLHLMKDQYGNYVIQKLLLQLRGTEYDNFVELIKPQLQLVKRFSYGKQVGAIEKLVYVIPPTNLHISNNPALASNVDSSAAPTPPLVSEDTQSPQSSSVPSTNTSTVDGPVGDGKTTVNAAIDISGSDAV